MMNFSRLNLRENAAGVSITSNNPAARVSQASAKQAGRGQGNQTTGTQNSRATQTAQATGQTTGGQGTNSVIRKKSTSISGGDAPVNTLSASYDALRANVELVKLREAAKCDWRQEIMEAANPNDDPNHPFVEVMPYNDYRMKEAQRNMVKAAQKDKQAGGITNMPGMKEETINEALPLAGIIGSVAGKAAAGGAAKATAGMAAKGGVKKLASKVATNVAGSATETAVSKSLSSKESDD